MKKTKAEDYRKQKSHKWGKIVGIATIIGTIFAGIQLYLYINDDDPSDSTTARPTAEPTRPHGEGYSDQKTNPPVDTEGESSNSASSPFALVYADKTFGLNQPDCDSTWTVDFEARSSESHKSDELDNELRTANAVRQQAPYDMYYSGCSANEFGPYNNAGIVQTKPQSPEECFEAARTGGWAGKRLFGPQHEYEVKVGVMICTATDQGVALATVKEMTGGDLTAPPTHITLDVTLWKRNV